MSKFLLSGLTQATTITHPTDRIMAVTLDFTLSKQVHSLVDELDLKDEKASGSCKTYLKIQLKKCL